MGRKVAEVTQTTRRTEFRYDALGRLISVPTGVGTAESATTDYTYDELGNRAMQTDAEARTTRWTHDAGGRETSRTLPGGQRETSEYNLAGERIAHTDFNGATTRYRYDAMGQLASVDFPRSPDVSIEYIADQPVRVTDGNGTTAFNCHPRGWLSGVEFPNAEAVAYRYDTRGNRTELITANQRLRYTYNELNQLTSISDDRGTTSFAYDAVGNRSLMVRPNGTRTRYGYDSQNRLTSLFHETTAGVVLLAIAYTLDDAGLRSRAEERDASGLARTITYTYDGVNRLVAESIIARQPGQSRTTGWTYDKVGNRQTETVAIGSTIVTTSYVYDANDRLLSESSGGQTTTYTYDANGNTKTRSGPNGLTEYAYDDANRLVEMREVGNRFTYAYDHDGLRISETRFPTSGAPVTTFYLLDKGREYAQVIEEHVQEGSGPRRLAAVYTFGDDLIAQTRGSETRYVHADGMSSTRLLTDSTGAVTDTFAFDAFGNELARTGNTVVGHLYRGEQFDPNLGFYNLRARFYDPKTGRFATMDSFAGFSMDPPSLHKCLYAHADPVNHMDPSGYFTMKDAMAAISNLAVNVTRTVINVARVVAGRVNGQSIAQFSVRTRIWLTRAVNQVGGRLPKSTTSSLTT